MKKIILALVASLCLSAAAMAADVTGKWAAEMPGRQGATQKITMDLKQDGATVTGAIVTPRGEQPITGGKVDGDTITFSQHMEMNGNSMDIVYTGKIEGNTIKFTRGMGERKTEFTATKQ